MNRDDQLHLIENQLSEVNRFYKCRWPTRVTAALILRCLEDRGVIPTQPKRRFRK